MAEAFVRSYEVAWADLDANAHLRNTAYFDYAAQTRFAFFAENGFPPSAFAEHRVGPVALEERIRYFRELSFLDRFNVDLTLAASTDDGARFEITNTFVNADGKACAELTTFAAWFDLDQRRVAPPPAALAAAMERLPRSKSFRRLGDKPDS
ncbi:MAG: thioesterase family protein [Pseudomonadota bacterium]